LCSWRHLDFEGFDEVTPVAKQSAKWETWGLAILSSCAPSCINLEVDDVAVAFQKHFIGVKYL
jgi:hypothetical protein